MSTARVLLTQGNVTYRFLRFETSGDGSLLAFLDRDARSKRGSMTMNGNGIFIPDEDDSDRALPSARFSIHTTGVVHYYSAGQRKETIHIEPLYSLTKVHVVGFVSIPRVSLLDKFDENKDRHDIAVTIDIPEHISDRVTFLFELGPNPQQPATYGVALNYELYSAVVRLVSNCLNLPPAMTDHFIHGIRKSGQFEHRQIDKAKAELEFHQRVHGRNLLVFREDSGAYVLLTVEPMYVAPQLKIDFDKDDLRIEIIPFGIEPSHKMQFWICDKGGRNKKDDLRGHIASIKLEAEL